MIDPSVKHSSANWWNGILLAAALFAGMLSASTATAEQQAEAEQTIESAEVATDEAPTEPARSDLPPGIREGVALLNDGKAQEAAAVFEKMLQADPRNASARHFLGEAWLALARKDKAQAEFEASLKLDPKHPYATDSQIRLAGLQAERKREPAATTAQSFPKPGEEIRDCPKCPVMVVLPAGTFAKGYPPGDSGRLYEEGPVRNVTIGKPFAIGKFEVTYDEWDACVAEKGCPAIDDKGRGRGRRPVAYVTWEQAGIYAKWLSGKTGKQYRLPSDAEWEYAARAGNENRYRFFRLALEKVCAIANVYDKRGKQQVDTDNESLPCDDKFAEAAPVGSFKPNAFGVHDTTGNVAEWVEDCMPTGLQWRGAPIDGTAQTNGDCSQRAFRGGSWLGNERRYLRSPDYFKYLGARDADLGFRLMRVLP
jgi:formylglycine-generating enzyme required for sulfatase activity